MVIKIQVPNSCGLVFEMYLLHQDVQHIICYVYDIKDHYYYYTAYDLKKWVSHG